MRSREWREIRRKMDYIEDEKRRGEEGKDRRKEYSLNMSQYVVVVCQRIIERTGVCQRIIEHVVVCQRIIEGTGVWQRIIEHVVV